MNEMEGKCCHGHGMGSKRFFSWTAVFAGALVALGIGFLMYLLTLGAGLETYTPNPQGVMTLAVGGFVWSILCSYFAMFFGGWVAGRLSRPYLYHRAFGLLHGFLAWCVSLIFLMIFLTHLGTLAAIGTAHYNDTTMGKSMMTQSSTMFPTQGPSMTGNTMTSGSQTTMTPADQKEAAKALGIGVLATFLMFFVGAIGACLGGFFGIERPGHIGEISGKGKTE